MLHVLFYAECTYSFHFKFSCSRYFCFVIGAVYWTDSLLKVIKRVRLPVTGGRQQMAQVVITRNDADRPEGIAIDWVGGYVK